MKLCDALKIKLTNEEKELVGKPLLKTVMRKFLPAVSSLCPLKKNPPARHGELHRRPDSCHHGPQKQHP